MCWLYSFREAVDCTDALKIVSISSAAPLIGITLALLVGTYGLMALCTSLAQKFFV
jgi:hypothetical protein